MAIGYANFKLIVDQIPDLLAKFKEVRILSLGYPDLLVSKGEMSELLGSKVTHSLKVRPDSKQIIIDHDSVGRLDIIFDAYDVFEKLGCKLTVFDIYKIRGDEVNVDLNKPIANKYKNHFHLLIDPGTLEHCFNVGQAIKNLAEMAVVGGKILNHNPSVHINHGFYNFSPVFYYDFYYFNGFEILSFPLVDGGTFHHSEMFFGNTAMDYNNLLVERVELKEIQFPNQGYYTYHSYFEAIRKVIEGNKSLINIGLVPTGAITELLLERGLGDLFNLSLFDNAKSCSSAGTAVYPTSEIGSHDIEALFITSPRFETQLIHQLGSLNFDLEKIFFYRKGNYQNFS